MGLTDLSDYIPKLISAIGSFLSSGIMFYIMAILIFAIIIDNLLKIIGRR